MNFRPDDLVVYRNDPREAWRVTGYYPRGDRIVCLRLRRSHYMSGPEEHWVLAPPGWRDPPLPPLGSVSYGMDPADWRDKHDRDEADPLYQAAMQQYIADLAQWDREHREPLLARLAQRGEAA